MFAKFSSAALFLCFLMLPYHANATEIKSYVYDAATNSFVDFGSLRFYQGDPSLGGSNSQWGLNGATNSIESSADGIWKPLNTTLFTVNDIRDITYTHAGTAFLTTNAGGSYVYDAATNSFVDFGSLRFYQGDPSLGGSNSQWGLNGATNSIESSADGIWKPLNTTLFTVNDIRDITYTHAGTAFFTVVVQNSVPEPASYALILTSLGLMGLFSRCRKANNAGI